jgi:aldehyde dehydrogenase (NAD+)
MRLAIPAQVHQAKQLVDDALSRGGKLLLPQEVVTSNSECRPTVVIDANEDMALCHDACFAPIFAVTPFDTLEEALERNERCPYALGASIFTPNLTLAGQIANRLKAGSVAVNDVILPTSHPATPFGGSGASGWGTTQGAEGLLEMTVPQVVSYKSGTLRLHYDMGDPVKLQKQGELLRGFLEASHAPSFGRRLKGWWKVIRTAMKGL